MFLARPKKLKKTILIYGALKCNTLAIELNILAKVVEGILTIYFKNGHDKSHAHHSHS